MGPKAPPAPTISPETRALQQQVEQDKIETIQDRVGQDTRDLLIQFGRRRAFGGAGIPGFGSLVKGL